jgi:hypothetical protein
MINIYFKYFHFDYFLVFYKLFKYIELFLYEVWKTYLIISIGNTAYYFNEESENDILRVFFVVLKEKEKDIVAHLTS